MADSALRPLGIDVGALWKDFTRAIAHVASETCAHLGSLITFAPEQVPLIEGAYVGEGYGVASKGGIAAIRRLAAAEGLILDPVYTGKAFAGMLDLAERGELGPDDPVIFVHTGGQPALFALGEALQSSGSGH